MYIYATAIRVKGYVGGYDFDSDYVDYILAKYPDSEVNVLIDSLGGSLATAHSIMDTCYYGRAAELFPYRAKEAPYPIVEITEGVSPDANLYDIKVTFSRKKSLIPCSI